MKRQFIQQLLTWRDQKDRKPLILNGARQVGKTYLLTYSEKYPVPYRTIMSAKPLLMDVAHAVHHYPLYLAGRFPLI